MIKRNRWLPHPLASVTLWAVWLMINSTIAPAHQLLGAFLGWAIPWLTSSLWPDRLWLRPGLVAVRLTVVVLYDIALANITVARLILGPMARLRPAFIQVPLVLEEPFAIASLASIITMTPGTVSARLSEDRRFLLVHVLDLDDEAALIAAIKTRYEAPLKEIFEC